MGSLLKSTDYDWPSSMAYLRKSRKIWSCLGRISGREGAGTRTSGRFHVAVAQAIILFVLETWVVNARITWIWGGFRHSVARQISGNIPCRWVEGTWEYPPLEEAMMADGLEEI